MSDQLLEKLPPIEDEHIIRSGTLSVGDGHEIYWVDWGNKSVKEPIFYIHGGPGSGFSERDFSRFDPSVHRVVFHDQRGSSRSTPFATTDHNTTQDLIQDITKLRTELGFEKISLYGFSWGSTLSLLYAIENPSVVEKMLIGGIYLTRKVDNEFYLQGKIASHFPEVWERFLSHVPKAEQTAPAEYYKKMMQSTDEATRNKFAKEWMLYESSTLKLDYFPANLERELSKNMSASLAFLESHYILNDCFIEENYILKNAAALKNIAIVIVHGRYDFICMPSAAYELKKVLPHALLHIVAAGHSTSDPVQREVVRAYTNMLWPKP
jgi:proline iminopeptidase